MESINENTKRRVSIGRLHSFIKQLDIFRVHIYVHLLSLAYPYGTKYSVFKYSLQYWWYSDRISVALCIRAIHLELFKYERNTIESKIGSLIAWAEASFHEIWFRKNIQIIDK